MKLHIHVREPLGNMVYFPQIINYNITYIKPIIMQMINGEIRDFFGKAIKTTNII